MSDGRSESAGRALERAQRAARRLGEIAEQLEGTELESPAAGPSESTGEQAARGPSGGSDEGRVAELAREAAELVREGEEAIEAAARSAESRER